MPLLEAMMLKRSIAASNISPVIEVTEDYDSITYFDSDNVEAISRALLSSLELPSSKVGFKEDKATGWQVFFDNLEAIKKAE
ncbi:hypothetical protein [Bombilactobacillus apium]|uniref:hypothetical protein n=1 Tax=Bombilactobacillus apium TaxID=2675299 RepID=UPI001E44FECD